MEKKKNRLFENHSHAEVYAKYRVSPPLELIERIMTFLKDKVKAYSVQICNYFYCHSNGLINCYSSIQDS